MSLRIQLLVVALLTLALPWAGYRYVQELEGALRAGLEQSLIASANTMASALELQPLSESGAAPGMPVDASIYAHPLSARPSLDGERNDWISGSDVPRNFGGIAEFWAGTHERAAYVFLSVTDDNRVTQRAPTDTPFGDRVLVLPGPDPDGWLLIHRSGPGVVRAQTTSAPLFAPTGEFEDRVSAFWRESANGYDVEIRLPMDLVNGRLGLAIVDVDDTGGSGYAVELVRSWNTSSSADHGDFIARPQSLDAIGDQFVQPGRRMRIIDSAGWVVFDAGAIDPVSGSFAPSSLSVAERIYRLILARGDEPYQELEDPPGNVANETLRLALSGESVAAWYTRGTDASSVVAAAAPIGPQNGIRGSVILEQGSDSILTLTNEALVRLMSFTLLASLVVAFGLLGYATLLSLRVRRLARAADTALSPEGEIRPSLPGCRARDELGDLSRSFSDLLNRLRDYTDYLTTLKAKLAHELRTPLAVVSTSLENLEREPHDQNLVPYLTRLREGTDRLDAILGAMSEATRIEQAVNDTEAMLFDLSEVVASCFVAYGDVYPDHKFEFNQESGYANVLGSPELIAQMLDKLADNAASFSPPESTIRIDLASRDDFLILGIENQGPLLPDSMRNQLFDSLVTMRGEKGDRRHLGLGLYIVALIVDFHQGSVRAEDLPDGSGVRFEVELPRSR
jgi:dedicated sortase system histidine kinase